MTSTTSTTENLNKLTKLRDQWEYLHEETDADKATMNRIKSKLEAAAQVLDMKQAEKELDDAETVLDGLELMNEV